MSMGMAWCVVTADAQSIVRVDIRDEGEPAPLARGVQERRLTKFMDDWPPTGDVVYDVHWDASASGLAGPVAVLMAYRQAGSRDVRSLIVRYADGARGPQIARFRIGADQVRRDGAVTAWRIQLRQDDRVLDDRVTGGRRQGHDNGRREQIRGSTPGDYP